MSKSIALYPDPIPGVPIVEPDTIPISGEVVIGYELIKNSGTLFTAANPKKMSKVGWFSVIGLLICCWPCAFIPCITSCSYESVQRPVYGLPDAVIHAESTESIDRIEHQSTQVNTSQSQPLHPLQSMQQLQLDEAAYKTSCENYHHTLDQYKGSDHNKLFTSVYRTNESK